MNPRLNQKLKLIVFICITFLFGSLIYFRWEVIKDALADHYLVVIYATVLSIIAISLQAMNFLQLLDSPFKPKYFSMSRIWALSNLANYLAPFQPGLAVRMIFLKQHGVSAWITTRTTVRQLQLSIWAAVGLFALAGVFNKIFAVKIMAATSAAIFILWPLILLLTKLLVLGKCENYKIIKKFRAEFEDLLAPMPLNKFVLPIVQYLIIAVSVFIVYRDFGADIFWYDALLIAVATSISALFSITPNNFGIQELLLGYSAHVTGLSVNDAISIAVLYRLVHLGSCSTILLLAFVAPKCTSSK